MLVRDATISNPMTVAPAESLMDFIDTVLDTNQTTAVVIAGDGALLGVVSVHDIFRVTLPHYLVADDKLTGVLRDGYFAEKFAKFRNIRVSEIMRTEVDTLGPNDAIIQAVGLFVGKQRKMIPVVEDGKFLGIITRRSVLRFLRSLPH